MRKKNSKKELSPQNKLLELAHDESAIYASELRRIFWLLNAPKNLYSFPLAFSNLINIFELLRAIANIRLADYKIDIWLEVLSWVVNSVPRWQNEFENEALLPPSERQKKEMEGLVPNGLYAMCCCSHENAEYHVDYRLLQGHCVIAHTLLFPTLVEQKEYEKFEKLKGKQHDIIYKATLGIRQLSYSDSLPILRIFPAKQTFDQFKSGRLRYQAKLSAFGNDAVAKNLYNYIKLLKGSGHSSFNAGKPKGISSGKQKSIFIGHGYIGTDKLFNTIFTNQDIDDPNCDWGSLHTISEQDTTIPSEEEMEEIEADTHPAEVSGQGELAATKFFKKGALSYFSAKGQHRHRQMYNQMFPWSYNVLTLQEASVLVEQIESTYSQLSEKEIWENSDYQLIETIIALSAMFWLGAPLERVFKLELYDSRNGSDSELAVNLDQADGVWQIKSINPVHFVDDTLNPELIRKPIDYLYLPDLFNIKGKLSEWLKRSLVMAIPCREVFPNINALKFYINKFLGTLGNKRITIAKIENFIFSKIYEKTQNVAIASYITAKEHNLSSVKTFYFTPSLEFLWKTYTDVTSQLHKEIFPHQSLKSISPPDLSDMYIGAKYCPKLFAVRLGIKKLKIDISIAAKENNFLKLHNLYTLYTIMLFGYTTALRAIRSPLIKTDQINKNYSFTVLADKENYYGSKSRPVSIPPILQEQLDNHEKHCQLLAETMHLNMETLQQYPCFFLDENETPIEVRPKQVTEFLQPYVPVRANAHRRFIYTYLTENSCPPEVVDAWMGHAANGLESWGAYSSLAFFEHTETLQEYLFSMLIKLGWEQLKSPLNHDDRT